MSFLNNIFLEGCMTNISLVGNLVAGTFARVLEIVANFSLSFRETYSGKQQCNSTNVNS